MLAALVHGLAYLVLLPPWMGEDEPWHVEYAGHVGQGHLPWGGEEMRFGDRELMSLSQLQMRRKVEGLEAEEILRTQWALLDSMREHDFWARVDWAAWPGGAQSLDQVVEAHTAAHQPPLYYLLGGALLYVAGATDVEARMWLLRILSLVAYVAVVAATFALAERTCRDPWVAVACALLVAWWPMHARQAGVANNDVLVKVLTSWTLLVAVDLAREGITARRMVKALALCAAALATKTTGAAALAPVALACAWRGGRRATGWRSRPPGSPCGRGPTTRRSRAPWRTSGCAWRRPPRRSSGGSSRAPSWVPSTGTPGTCPPRWPGRSEPSVPSPAWDCAPSSSAAGRAWTAAPWPSAS
jgi:hypothetical protein